jgi:hypothetical protein
MNLSYPSILLEMLKSPFGLVLVIGALAMVVITIGWWLLGRRASHVLDEINRA